MYRVLIYCIVFISFLNCNSQTKSRESLFKQKIADYLNNKGLIAESDYERFVEKDVAFFNVQGVFNYNKGSDSIVDGIYKFDTGLHSLSYYLILENDEIKFLDISNDKNFLSTIYAFLNYFQSKNYCKELINSYLSEVLSSYYVHNKSIVNAEKNQKCKRNISELKSSSIPLQGFKITLEDYLLEDGINLDTSYDPKLDLLALESMGIYNEISYDNEHLNEGVYTFYYYEQVEPYIYFITVNNDKYEIYKLNDFESYKSLIGNILIQSDQQRNCYKITRLILERFIELKYDKSCFLNKISKLP